MSARKVCNWEMGEGRPQVTENASSSRKEREKKPKREKKQDKRVTFRAPGKGPAGRKDQSSPGGALLEKGIGGVEGDQSSRGEEEEAMFVEMVWASRGERK